VFAMALRAALCLPVSMYILSPKLIL